MRGIRFAALSGFSFVPETKKAFEEYAKTREFDNFRILCGLKKIIEDRVVDSSLELMKSYNFPRIKEFPNFYDYMNYISEEVKKGNFKVEAEGGYHTFGDLHPRRNRQQPVRQQIEVDRVQPDVDTDFFPF